MKETNAGLCRNQTIKMAQKTTKCSAELWKNSLCTAFLLIPTLGNSGWTLFLKKFQTVSVRTCSLVHFILPWIYKQGTIRQYFRKINTKRRCCADSDPTVMSHHTNASNCLILRGHYCFVSYYKLLDMYWIFVHFLPKWQHHLSMKDVGCQT